MTDTPLPSDLAGAPLGELKQWLAISGTRDDALLLRLLEAACRMCQRFTGASASEWSALAEDLRHGILRLAAHHYRERDTGDQAPPAIVAALWRPHRALRL